MLGEINEYLFRALFVIFSLCQLVSLGSPEVTYCTIEVKALNMEADWTRNLAISQLL